MYKNVNTVSDEFFRTKIHQPSLSMTSLSLAGDASTAQVHREVLMLTCRRVHHNIIVYLADICTL